MEYIDSLIKYKRFETYKVNVGGVKIGGENPIRVQTMCNTSTADVEATVKQITKLSEMQGCEIVRVTVPTMKDVGYLKDIKRILLDKGITMPVVADVHFLAQVALACAEQTDKVRINPGNFCHHDLPCFTKEEYDNEAAVIEKNFAPLIEICRKHGTALRIGTNHGSLSKRILNRFGDTPEGMVESVMEFLRIAKRLNFNNIVISLKSSNPSVMVKAARLLVKVMRQENMNFPLHLGVTEAGEGLEGRMKSAAGIGALLFDGIGDTVRVSLTENPEYEIAPAMEICRYALWRIQGQQLELSDGEIPFFYNPYSYKRRESIAVGNFGGTNVPTVAIWVNDEGKDIVDFVSNVNEDKLPDVVFVNNEQLARDILNTGRKLKVSVESESKIAGTIPYYHYKTFAQKKSGEFCFVIVDEKSDFKQLSTLLFGHEILIAAPKFGNKTASLRYIFYQLHVNNIKLPVLIKPDENIPQEYNDLAVTAESSAVFIDGLGDGVVLNTNGDVEKYSAMAFDILQICRLRISKNEYISCPGCGRTLYDLQTTVKKIKNATSKYKNLKIAVMGCIVNGPGEMADADYGYVGAGVGKISLYRNKEVVKRGIPEENAVEELIKLIEDK